MKRRVVLIAAVAACLALLAIVCCELVRWSVRERDNLAIGVSSFALGLTLWMLAWWLMTWTRQIWRDVAIASRNRER